VVALDGVRGQRLATVIADELRTGYCSTCHYTEDIGDVDLWRHAARRADRLLRVPVRTGVAPDGSKVWASDAS
jgi:hypothetical protein